MRDWVNTAMGLVVEFDSGTGVFDIDAATLVKLTCGRTGVVGMDSSCIAC
jgi:hypothetical protein